jgi:hypothetical protein
MSSAGSTLASVWSQISQGTREWLLLRDAERTLRSYSDEQYERVWLYSRAADARVRLARDAYAPTLKPVATELMRQALVQRVLAFAVARGRMETASDVGRELALAATSCHAPSATVEIARKAIDQDASTLDFERKGLDELGVLREAFSTVERAIRVQTESRTLARVKAERVSRCAGVALAIGYIAFLAYHAMFDAPNIAFHKRVTTSGAPPLSAERLVDGVRDPLEVDVLAEPSPDAWVDIDLGGPYVIDHAVITNRTDRAFDASLPLVLEASSDGRAYTLVELRRLHFTRWVAPMHGMRATHIRVRSKAPGVSLGLNELEVYGRYSP